MGYCAFRGGRDLGFWSPSSVPNRFRRTAKDWPLVGDVLVVIVAAACCFFKAAFCLRFSRRLVGGGTEEAPGGGMSPSHVEVARLEVRPDDAAAATKLLEGE